jgi:hypothetical protein
MGAASGGGVYGRRQFTWHCSLKRLVPWWQTSDENAVSPKRVNPDSDRHDEAAHETAVPDNLRRRRIM